MMTPNPKDKRRGSQLGDTSNFMGDFTQPKASRKSVMAESVTLNQQNAEAMMKAT